jgi:AraC-like DNA-binding protein
MKTQAKKQPRLDSKNILKNKSVFGFFNGFNSLIEYFQMGKENDEPVFQILDMFPIPIEVFSPDGTAVYANRAGAELNNIRDLSLVIGKYNLLKDPVCMDKLGYRNDFQKAFNGEMMIVKGFPAPIDDLVERSVVKKNEKPFEKATMDLYFYPIWKDDKLYLVVCVFVVRNLYLGRPDVARARDYIDKNWQGEFDSKVLAKSVHMSVPQLYSLFKQHIGMPPGDYHKKCKIEHIKEKLADKNLSIKEAFIACGEDSRGRIARVFKEITGMSPKQYRESIKIHNT